MKILNLENLKLIFKKCWSKETSYPSAKKDWSSKNPSLGQCAVAPLIIQDIFGGDLLYCKHQSLIEPEVNFRLRKFLFR